MKITKQTEPVALAHGHTNIADVVFTNSGHSCSWERYPGPDTFQTMYAQRHLGAGWVAIKVREQGTKSTRETYITLDRAQALELKKLLDVQLVTVNGEPQLSSG